jgi:hypothetical protein
LSVHAQKIKVGLFPSTRKHPITTNKSFMSIKVEIKKESWGTTKSLHHEYVIESLTTT